MCLITKRKSPHRLKRDMRCWKVVYKSNENECFKPIYYNRNTKYRLNTTHVDRCWRCVRPYWGEKGMYEVGAGFIHAFISLDKAINMQQQRASIEAYYKSGRTPVVCECVIPAGTKIYYNLTECEVCARKLRFVKILEP